MTASGTATTAMENPITISSVSATVRSIIVGDDGMLVRSQWVQDDEGDWYFVNSAGQKITNDWRLTTPYEDEDAEEEWFYFQASGKVATNKKIVYKGNTYFFDEEGKMLTGWVQESGDDYIEADESGISNTYYCDETGARIESNWVWDYAPGVDEDDSDEEEHYFYMKSNGKIQTGKASNIKGQTYLFDADGKMLTGWVAKESDSDAYYSIEGDDDTDGIALSDVESGEVYYCTLEDGHVKKNKWIKLWNSVQAYDEDEDNSKKWFYLNKNGEVYIPSGNNAEAKVEGAAKYTFEEGKLHLDTDNASMTVYQETKNGKDYFFNANGEMISGFVRMDVNGEGVRLYYLGGSDDGVMKTGSQTIKDDVDDSYRFYFETKGTNKGAGIVGNRSNKLYYDGMLITADENRYEIAQVGNYEFIVNQSGTIQHSNIEYKESGDTLVNCKEATYLDSDNEYENSVTGYTDVDTDVFVASERVYD